MCVAGLTGVGAVVVKWRPIVGERSEGRLPIRCTDDLRKVGLRKTGMFDASLRIICPAVDCERLKRYKNAFKAYFSHAILC